MVCSRDKSLELINYAKDEITTESTKVEIPILPELRKDKFSRLEIRKNTKESSWSITVYDEKKKLLMEYSLTDEELKIAFGLEKHPSLNELDYINDNFDSEEIRELSKYEKRESFLNLLNERKESVSIYIKDDICRAVKRLIYND